MREIEILSSIPKDKFYERVEAFTKEYGEPKRQKRLGLVFVSYENGNKVDTRLKITNGKAHLVQKQGEGLAAFRSNIETELDLEMSPEDLLRLIRMFQYMGSAIEGFTSPLQQYDNFLFDTGKAEIKMYKQFNSKNAFYGFEVEASVVNEQEIIELSKSLGLEPDNLDRGGDYWYEYDKTYNADSLSMSDDELLELLERYLD